MQPAKGRQSGSGLRQGQVSPLSHGSRINTANSTEVVLAETEQDRGILGVVDGWSRRASRTRSSAGRTSWGRLATSSEPPRREDEKLLKIAPRDGSEIRWSHHH
jgi:hypothetical protein